MTTVPGFSLAARLRAGEAVYSGWCSMASPLVTEVVARAGFPAVTIDGQHGLWDTASTFSAIAAIRQGGSAPLVRIPLAGFGFASRVLDVGAEGIVAPMINTVEDARALVAATKFPPMGERSWGPHRATMQAGIADQKVYLTEGNNHIVNLAMIETRTAMDNLDAIAATPGIDVLFIGPSDLSITLSDGKVLEPHSKEVEAGLDKILAAAKKAGKLAGIYCANADRALACAKRGFRFMAVASDLNFLREGIAGHISKLKG
ncbi:MAG TPA: aldolase/citrate lyase family protein [Pseudolabrys sp.]|nr:aldolase/citrate lyase family protein [Pseudolabrys sp.]